MRMYEVLDPAGGLHQIQSNATITHAVILESIDGCELVGWFTSLRAARMLASAMKADLTMVTGWPKVLDVGIA